MAFSPFGVNPYLRELEIFSEACYSFLRIASSEEQLSGANAQDWNGTRRLSLARFKMTTLGERLKAARLQAGFENQSDFSKQLGITRQAVSAWEHDVSEPSTKQMRHVAQITHTSVDYLATGEGDRKIYSKTVVGALIVGTAEAEVWREGEAIRAMIESGKVPNLGMIPVVPTAGIEHYYVVQVQGASANLTMSSGEHAIWAKYESMRPHGPQDGDLVVLEKRRDHNKEGRVAIMRLRVRVGEWVASYESNDERWRDSIRLTNVRLEHSEGRTTWRAYDAADDHTVEIVGAVMGAFRFDPQPYPRGGKITMPQHYITATA
jgi:transcriptional regulator with XRE-family HTH domain